MEYNDIGSPGVEILFRSGGINDPDPKEVMPYGRDLKGVGEVAFFHSKGNFFIQSILPGGFWGFMFFFLNI